MELKKMRNKITVTVNEKENNIRPNALKVSLFETLKAKPVTVPTASDLRLVKMLAETVKYNLNRIVTEANNDLRSYRHQTTTRAGKVSGASDKNKEQTNGYQN